MTDYATADALSDLLPMVTVNEATEPTTAQVEGYITLRSAELDAVLGGRGYSLPVTDSDALAYLKTVCLYGVAAMVLRAKFPTSENVEAAYAALYRDALADIRDGRVLIPDAALETDTIGEGFTVDADGEATAPLITRKTEW